MWGPVLQQRIAEESQNVNVLSQRVHRFSTCARMFHFFHNNEYSARDATKEQANRQAGNWMMGEIVRYSAGLWYEWVVYVCARASVPWY